MYHTESDEALSLEHLSPRRYYIKPKRVKLYFLSQNDAMLAGRNGARHVQQYLPGQVPFLFFPLEYCQEQMTAHLSYFE